MSWLWGVVKQVKGFQEINSTSMYVTSEPSDPKLDSATQDLAEWLLTRLTAGNCRAAQTQHNPVPLVTDLSMRPISSSPEAADSSSFDVQLGDIILTATDGLFDNMPDYMILQELKKLKVAHFMCSYISETKTSSHKFLIFFFLF